jgi:non-ribosomal peptide synthetase component E (peptide arylation enzyme)
MLGEPGLQGPLKLARWREALIEFARARIGYKAPEEIVFLEQLPLNTVGKVDRAALKRMAAPDRPGR